MNADKLRLMELCGKYLIDVSIALENAKIVAAVKARNWKLVEQLLEEEF